MQPENNETQRTLPQGFLVIAPNHMRTIENIQG